MDPRFLSAKEPERENPRLLITESRWSMQPRDAKMTLSWWSGAGVIRVIAKATALPPRPRPTVAVSLILWHLQLLVPRFSSIL
jgi:hypothetical protein